MKLLITLVLLTSIHGDKHKAVVYRGNQIVAAFVDGWICYGIVKPREADCHRAIAKPEIAWQK